MSSFELIASPPTRRRLWLRSLTSRLVAGVIALVVVLVAVIGGCTYYALRSFLTQRLDQQLGPIAQANKGVIQFCLESPSQTCPFRTSLGASYRTPQTE